MLSAQQTRELKILEVTARVFQVLVQHESVLPFDAYKRHHSQPELIVEQLLMNSHIDLCSRTLKILRESLANDIDGEFFTRVNDMLVRYARKALELRVGCMAGAGVAVSSSSTSVSRPSTAVPSEFTDSAASGKRLSLAIPSSASRSSLISSSATTSTSFKSRKQSHPIDHPGVNYPTLSPGINIIASSSPSSSISSSFKNKFGWSSNTNTQINTNL